MTEVLKQFDKALDAITFVFPQLFWRTHEYWRSLLLEKSVACSIYRDAFQ